MTEPEEKAQRWRLMEQHQQSELDAALQIAAEIDRLRGMS